MRYIGEGYRQFAKMNQQQSTQDEKVDPSTQTEESDAPTQQNWHETFYRIVIAQRQDVENEDEDENLEVLALGN